ncbi:MAG: hypothetical protein K8S54_03705 [Spirochaetia bacterium]|nr:hypothetical protein [Spirochaetia bacterium]
MSDDKDVASKVGNLALPFTLYDFFGYLLPGVVFWMAMLLSLDATHFVLGMLAYQQPMWGSSQQLRIFHAVQELVKGSPWFISVSSALLCYITGHLVSAISSFFGERLFVERTLGYPGRNLFLKNAPTGFWATIFRKFVRPYSPEFQKAFNKQFKHIFGIDGGNPNDRFWLAFEYIAHWCPSAFARSMHFLNLYGFNRNISYSLILAAVASCVVMWLRKYPCPLLIPLLLIVASLPFYWNYLKLLRRLNDEVFRSFYIHACRK